MDGQFICQGIGLDIVCAKAAEEKIPSGTKYAGDRFDEDTAGRVCKAQCAIFKTGFQWPSDAAMGA